NRKKKVGKKSVYHTYFRNYFFVPYKGHRTVKASPRHWAFFFLPRPDVGKEKKEKGGKRERKKRTNPPKTGKRRERRGKKRRGGGKRGTKNTRTKLFWRTRFPIELQPEDKKGRKRERGGRRRERTNPLIP